MPDQRIIALLDTMIRIAKGEENINLAQETINQLAALNRGLASRVVAVSEIAKEDNEFDLLGALKDMRNEQTDTPSSSEPSQTGGINFPDEPRAPPGKQGIFSESGSFLDRAWDRAHQDLSDPEPHGNVEWAASHQFGRREFIIAATVLIALITGIIGYSYITAPTETTPATATRVVNVEERDAPSPKMTVTSTPPTHPPKQASKPTKPTQPAKAPKANPPTPALTPPQPPSNPPKNDPKHARCDRPPAVSSMPGELGVYVGTTDGKSTRFFPDMYADKAGTCMFKGKPVSTKCFYSTEKGCPNWRPAF